jgi:alpha/beta superfamily hydrolase
VAQIIMERSTVRRIEAARETPLFFPSAGRPLYGAFHPAQHPAGKKQVLVICHAIGTEHMLTQRIEALAARTAAKAGFAAFRYNARAHGDSAGEARDVTFEALVEDACAAADRARELSGASRIIWLGVRLGCLVAAEAMSRRDDAGALALWEPVHRGADYFRSQMRAIFFAHVANGRRPNLTVDDMLERLEREGEFPVIGGYVYRALFNSARSADLVRSLPNWHGHTLIAQLQRRRSVSEDNERLRSAVEQTNVGTRVTVVLITKEPPWNMMPIVKPQWTSDDLLGATKEWLGGLE